MIHLRKINNSGFFVEDVIVTEIPYLTETIIEESVDEEGNPAQVEVGQPILDEHGTPIPDPSYIVESVPPGFYHPKWDGENWVEGMSQEQIDALKNQLIQLTPEQEEMKILKRRLDEAENTVVFLLDMNLMGGM